MSYRVFSFRSPLKALLRIVFRGILLTSLENKQIILIYYMYPGGSRNQMMEGAETE